MNLSLNINVLDIVLLIVMGLFAVRGALRGFIDEVAGLIGLILGFWLSGKFYLSLSELITPYFDSQWIYIIAYAIIFMATVLVVGLIAKGLHAILEVAYAAWLNHLAGAAVGFAKGFLICAILVLLLEIFMKDAEFFKDSQLVEPTRALINLLKGHLPLERWTHFS